MPDAASPALLGRLIAHMRWADARVAAALADARWDGAPPPGATRTFAHLAGAARVWLARLDGTASPLPVWPDALAPADAAHHLAIAHEAFATVAADTEALARRVAYVTSAGQAFENTAADILAHVVQHAAHHRGQIAAAIRASGQAPPSTDFILFARAPDA